MAEVDSPVLFIMDADQEARLVTESALVRHFGADYRVLASGTPQHGVRSATPPGDDHAPLVGSLVSVQQRSISRTD